MIPMSEGFSLDSLKDTAQEAANTANRQTKNLVPWLEDPKQCENCNSYCDADYQYVDGQAQYMQVWQCPNCEKRYFRDRV